MNTRPLSLWTLLGVLLLGTTVSAQGIFLPSAGPVNRGMAGASTAAPLDSIGAFYWNPATISALPSSEMAVGMELLLSDLQASSDVPGFGSGTTDSDSGASFLPSVGWVNKSPCSRLTWGMGVFAKAGFKTNYAGGANSTNPVFNSAALGRVYSKAEFIEIAPAVSYAVSENLSIGFGPTIGMGVLEADGFIFDANADGSYPSGSASRLHWGGGAQLGVFYRANCNTTLGASIKSPQWFETFSYQTTDENGNARNAYFDLDLPMIASVGLGYYGIENWVFALDARYIDYKNADGFGEQGFGFGPSGLSPASVLGLGWSSIGAVAMGAQYQVNELMTMRMGYSYFQNVMQDNDALIAVAAPLFQQHMAHGGASMWISPNVRMNAAYTYIFENDVTGPFAGGTVSTSANAHMLSMGATARY